MPAKPDEPVSQAALDLLWVLESPSFVAGPSVAPAVHVSRDAIDEKALDAFLAARASHRVGRYFEDLLLFWLEHVRRVEIVGSGIQIRDGKRTVGEIDFLFRDELGRLCHWEAAVKFFLHNPAASGSHFPGPNASDNFERKIAKLFGRQLPLSEIHCPDVEVRQAFMKGCLFYRHDAPRPPVLPDRMAAGHAWGTWFRASQLELLEEVDQRLGAVMHKPHWFAPAVDAELDELGDLSAALRRHFAAAAYPLMVSLRDPTSLTETDRLFVVADDWCLPGQGDGSDAA